MTVCSNEILFRNLIGFDDSLNLITHIVMVNIKLILKLFQK